MTVIGVTMVRDEVDVILSTVAKMAEEVDGLIVADNMSVDGTREALDWFEGVSPVPVIIVDDDEVGYEQSRKMTALALRARLDMHADWVVPFDADEVWYSPHGRIADRLDAVAPQFLVMRAALYDHVPTGIDLDTGDPLADMGWRKRKAAPLPKVAVRWREDLVIEMGNHGASYIGGATYTDEELVVRHFPYRSAEQVIRKIRNGAQAYKATDLPETYGAHWRQWGQILDEQGEEAIEMLFKIWHWREDPNLVAPAELPELIYDPCP